MKQNGVSFVELGTMLGLVSNCPCESALYMKEWDMIEKGGEQAPVVLLPGWGFTGEMLKDHALFSGRTVIWSPCYTSPDLLTGLSAFLAKNKIAAVELVGWSMGGNVAIDFALAQPKLISKLTLVAVRKNWPSGDVERTRQELLDPSGRGMGKFYRKCFLGAKADYLLFSERFLKSDNAIDTVCLSKGLDYLLSHQMPDSLPMPVHLFQGEKDVICPLVERVNFSSQSEMTMLAGAGHFLFSHAKFKL